MTVFFPVVWLKIMYSPGEVVASFSIFDVATSKVGVAAFDTYVFCILKISKGSSTRGGPFGAYST